MASSDHTEGGNPIQRLLSRLLSPITEVRPHEAFTALLMMLNIFLIMAAYYIIKPAREAYMSLESGGAELASYASAAMAVLLLPILRGYDRVSEKYARRRLITIVTLVFISNLAIFYYLSLVEMNHLGIVFFVWVGIFNYMVVAQFWGFANDVYHEAQGERLFPLIMIGQTTGAILGPRVASWSIEWTGDTSFMLLVAGALLGLSIAITLWVDFRARSEAALSLRRSQPDDQAALAAEEKKAEKPLKATAGFRLIWEHRYLLLMACLILLLNLVNTTGEYILRSVVYAEAEAANQARDVFAGLFYSDFFFWVNVVASLIQVFLVSRIFKYLGVRKSVYILPIISLIAYGSIALVPVLTVIMVVKIAENGTDYSLMNTLRAALYLPTTREMKYKAKMAIDTFFVRAGDVISAGFVALGSEVLNFGPQGFSVVVFCVVLVWLWLVRLLTREHRRISGDDGADQVT
ncbi:MAG TPA: Npt1/Npt2 family nucleotide transporter [Acidobacteriota bacterium]|nr:Npt1/Npt2 family nucleotide transporter [Acidobacteriota bacterium]